MSDLSAYEKNIVAQVWNFGQIAEGEETQMSEESYISIVQSENCKVCGAYKDLRYGCCFKCSEFVEGIEIPGGHELWDSRNPEIRWQVKAN